jgi:hypothetical protein
MTFWRRIGRPRIIGFVGWLCGRCRLRKQVGAVDVSIAALLTERDAARHHGAYPRAKSHRQVPRSIRDRLAVRSALLGFKAPVAANSILPARPKRTPSGGGAQRARGLRQLSSVSGTGELSRVGRKHASSTLAIALAD